MSRYGSSSIGLDPEIGNETVVGPTVDGGEMMFTHLFCL
jgi:hypothetical protein